MVTGSIHTCVLVVVCVNSGKDDVIIGDAVEYIGGNN